MSFKFENLDHKTRELMINEVELDINNKKLYLSPRLSDFGKKQYPQLLKNAILEGNETTLAANIKAQNCLNLTELRNTNQGTKKIVSVPVNACETLAEGEFNRFYIRALCRRVIEEELGTLEIYRAKQVSTPRIESQIMIGKIVNPEKLLNDLRTNIGVDTVLGLPPGPNSGLSVRIKS